MIPPDRKTALEAMQEHKRPRRLRLADDISILFESDATIDHQIREMRAMEDDAEALGAILAGYEEIRPGPDRITATVSVEVRDPAHIKTRLGYYAGLEQAFSLHDGKHKVPARIIGDHGTPEATTAVTYLAFDLPPGFQRADARLTVDHPRLTVDAALPPAVAGA